MRALAKLLLCELLKLRRKPLFWVMAASSVGLPLAFAVFLSDPADSESAVIQLMATMIQLSAYVVLIPAVAVLAANLLFEEQDSDTLKNLCCVPVDRAALAVAKLLLLLGFSVLFMAVGGLVNLVILLVQGWAPIGYWKLLGVSLVQGVLMWSGALPCVLLVVALNKSTILSVIITFFYTVANYITLMIPSLSTMPLGLNAGTLLPGALSLRWYSPFLSRSAASEPPLVQQLLAHAISTPTALGIAAAEAVVFIFLIALVYRRREP